MDVVVDGHARHGSPRRLRVGTARGGWKGPKEVKLEPGAGAFARAVVLGERGEAWKLIFLVSI